MIRKWIGRFVAAFIPLVICSPILYGDDGNYQNYIVGERAAGMGGAVTASCQALEAAYFNPSGLGFVEASRLSLSASLYGWYRADVKEGLGSGENYSANEFESIPSTFGSILNLSEEFTVAFSAFVPDQINYNLQETFERRPGGIPGIFKSDYYSQTLDDQQMWIGPSLGWRIDERLSIGGSVFLVYRTLVNKQQWTYLLTSGPDNEITSVSARIYNIDYSNYGLLGVFGAQYVLGDHILLGLSLQTPSLNLTGDGELLYTVSHTDEETVVHADDMKSRYKLPTKVTIGAAWRKEGTCLLEADLSYHFPTSYNALSGDDVWTGEPITTTVRRKPVINVNLGGEYYVIEDYPVRLGFFTNLSSAPTPEPAHGGTEKVDMYGLTASVGNEAEHTTINLGVNYVWGSGSTLGIGDDFSPKTVHVHESYIFIFLASTYIF